MSDQPKWTPGPWIVFTSEYDWGCDTFVGTLTDTLFDVRPWKGPAWQEANAHLIAAAPELYAALDLELSEVEGDIRWADDDELEQLCVRRDRIMATLARARGEAK